MQNAHLLLVEDNDTLGFILKEYLEMKSYKVTLAKDGREGLRCFKKGGFDLCILDIMMPERDGFSLATLFREINENIPIIFLTAKSLKEDILKGFDLGADDYIVKPVEEDELLARIKAVLRRSMPPEPIETQFQIGEYYFDFNNQKLSRGEEERLLTEREAKILQLLCINQGKLLHRQQVLKNVWKNSDYFTRRSMDVFISRLRKYLSADERIQINNVYGSGFILKIESPANEETLES